MKKHRLIKWVPIVVGVCSGMLIVSKNRKGIKEQIKQLSNQVVKHPYQSAVQIERCLEQSFKVANQKLDSLYNGACQLEELIDQIKRK
ncbi:hypothetical protein [Amphibacillus xylanus]|uniref:Uncharacterized protein n=1 Tax=Amphibacillus xylanus (strain ATCC 51415 / DSM 6626 / JCM 7361 / LMG 17667 / NBRC 15112 / Ep01) TaxID=698758 RepID=K0IWK8_AMPXN|nr:hypothetical protein [Amphibacillus xylanus]BAM46734.1 hypothetical protein AXY_06020 [Amphibacillus xylanus NBRC 15112]